MELRDYIAALRRHWPTWLGITLVGAVIALLVVTLSPRTYQATAQVFVSSSVEGTSSPQFISARVKSYPEVAVSAAVLAPVDERLQMHPSLQALRSHVSASNPADTSQINIVATADDAEGAAAIANAVAQQFTTVVEDLEKPATGNSPVTLTITNPATAPTSPASPQTLFVLVLGVFVALFLGLAVAILRSRMDSALYEERDVRDAWGEDDDLEVLQAPAGRRRRSRPGGRPAATLARRVELLAEAAPVRLTLLSPAPGERAAAQAFAAELAAELRTRELPTEVAGASAPAGRPSLPARVHLQVTQPTAALRTWRQAAAAGDAAVLVVPSGGVLAAELHEVQTVLRHAGVRVLAVVVPHRPVRAPWSRFGRSRAGDASSSGAAAPARAEATAQETQRARAGAVPIGPAVGATVLPARGGSATEAAVPQQAAPVAAGRPVSPLRSGEHPGAITATVEPAVARATTDRRAGERRTTPRGTADRRAGSAQEQSGGKRKNGGPQRRGR
jgi:capsular polysaccharide biosynthesis protein